MNKAIETMSSFLFDIKRDMKTNDYIELMNQLSEINKFKPVEFKYTHRVEYEMVSQVCYIDDDEAFLNIKKNNYYDSYEQYQEDEDDIDEDYERVKDIKTEGRFFCNTSEIIGEDTHTDYEKMKLIGEAKKNMNDCYVNPFVFEEHQREVQKYYQRYLTEWDDWVRIVCDCPIKITSVSFIKVKDEV